MSDQGTPKELRPVSTGRPAKPLPALTVAQIRRFWSYVRRAGSDECWLWDGPYSETNGHRYGQFIHWNPATKKRRNLLPHRVAKALTTEDRPDLEIDHLCNNKLCVNPDHLDWTTHTVNMTRGKQRRETCRRGHPAYLRNRFGQCPTCVAIRVRERQREEGAA